MKTHIIVGTLLGVLPWLTTPARAHDHCRASEVQSLGGTVTFVHGLNNLGEAIGRSSLSGDAVQHAFVWRGGHTTDLGTLRGGQWSEAHGVNDFGTVVGTAVTSDNAAVPVIWQHGRIARLALPDGETSGVAVGINDFGQITGNVGFSRCLLWQGAKAAPIDLGGLGGDFCEARAIDDAGEIVGTATTAVRQLHAFSWQSGVMRDLDLGAELPSSQANDINDRGEIAGFAYDSIFDARAVTWAADGTPDVIDIPAGRGTSINDFGDVAVFQAVGSDDARLRLVDRHGRLHDFGLIGGVPSLADYYINDRLQAVWSVLKPDGFRSFFCQLR